MKPFDLKQPETLEEASAMLEKRGRDARALAGGTDIIGGLKKNIYSNPPTELVTLKAIPGMDFVRDDGDYVSIGAMTSVEELANSELIQAECGLLAQAASQTASPLQRYTGTIAGNIAQDVRCWYFRAEDNYFDCLMKGGDTCYALLGDNRNHSIMGSAKVGLPACSQACPTGVDMATYMALFQAGDVDGAARELLSSNAIPAVTGRTCPHSCEPACSRKALDEEVGIRSVERYLGDQILDDPARFMTVDVEDSGKHVAIVGSGPAGLGAAFYLRKAGHKVTVFDQMETPGGLLMHGLPRYRISKQVVERQIEAFEAMGVVFRCGVKVGVDISLAELREGHDAVFVGAGAWKEREISIEGKEHCQSGIAALRQLNETGRFEDAGEGRVLIIGAGNAGVDLATSLKRVGGHPLVVDLMHQDDIKVIEHERATAEAEGVEFDYLTAPVSVKRVDQGFEVRCQKMMVQSRREDGTPVVTPVEGGESVLTVFAVLKCVGEQPDTHLLSDFVDVYTTHTGQGALLELDENLFAAGDFVSGPSTVVQALGAGRRAATAITKSLGGESPPSRICGLRPFDPARLKRKSLKTLENERSEEARLQDPLGEELTGLSKEAAATEANRCMTCGCIAASPSDLAPALLALGARVRTTLRTMDMEEFLIPSEGRLHSLEADELIREIVVPKSSDAGQVYVKFRTRSSIDFPIVSVAVRIEKSGDLIESARVVLGSVAPVPLRAKEAEKYLQGRKLSPSDAAQAGILALECAQAGQLNAHKIEIAKSLVKRAVAEAGGIDLGE